MNIRTKQWRRVTASIAVAGLVFAACGSDDDDAAEVTEDTADVTEDTAEMAEDTAEDDVATGDLSVPDSPDDGVTSDVIKIGWMGDITGPTASAQAFNFHGTDAYFECVNERGGILGRQVEFIAEDDQYSAEKAAVNYTKLAQDDKVLALTDMGGSQISTQLGPQIIEDGIATIGMGQTIDIQIDNPQFFNTIAHYGDQADAAWVQIASDLGDPTSAVVGGISLEVPSGAEWAAYVEQTVVDNGGTYVGTEFLAPAATEATAQVAKLKQWIDDEGVNYLALHGSPGAALVVLNSMADAGIVIPIVGIHGIASNSLWETGPADQVELTVGMHSFLTSNNDIEAGPEMDRCAELAGYADEGLIINFANGYAVGNIVEQAILAAAETGELTRASFTEALHSQVWDTGGITCPVDWTTSQHSPCVAAFTYDPATGGMVTLNPFEFYADSLDVEYGIDS
jgi:branched-chain amino acid transport system substrate-binding protein